MLAVARASLDKKHKPSHPLTTKGENGFAPDKTTRSVVALATLPTVLAVGTLLVGILTGYFQATAVKLENQKHDLQAEVQQFTLKKDELSSGECATS